MHRGLHVLFHSPLVLLCIFLDKVGGLALAALKMSAKKFDDFPCLYFSVSTVFSAGQTRCLAHLWGISPYTGGGGKLFFSEHIYMHSTYISEVVRSHTLC
ncbi:hypothetical protein B0T22DRAFT_471072 [Podospora appendiculata]|uniref:Secreted protein n=1 Tax=Podospora appendiculata TaxID=314037 RepID=A0AAE0X119_9PEZI|nr:hypothetical protein B0T22DRAFT_471072 [Podospora appendiculata]